MASYQPSAEDFEDIPDVISYQPTTEDFEEEQESYNEPITINPQAKERIGFKGIYQDVIEGLANALKSGKGFIKDIPSNLEKHGKYIEKNPVSSIFHDIGQIASSTAELGKGIINAPYDLNQYLAKKKILPTAFGDALSESLGKAGKFIPHIPEGTEKILGLEADPEKGDDLIRAIPALYGGGSLIGKGVSKVKKLANSPSKENLFQRALEKRIDEAAINKDISKSELKSLQDALKLDYSKIHGKTLGDVNPVSLEERINVSEHELADKKALTEIPEKQVGEIPPEPNIKAIIDRHKNALEKARADAEEALGILDNPRLKGGSKVKKAIEEVKSSASELYNAARKHYVDKKVSVDNSKEIKKAGEELKQLSANEGVFEGTTSEREALKHKIDALQEEKVNASDLFDIQRTLEATADNVRSRQFAGNVPELEFKRLGSIADQLDARAKQFAKRLESVGGKDVQKMITEANIGWRTFKNLSKRNPVGKAALKGELPTRSMIEIAKDHPGNDFLQKLVESDPELKKNMLAAYAGESNINKLLKPTTLARRYIEDLPEVEEHVISLKQSLTGVKEGEVKASRVKKEYDDLVKSMKDAAKEQKIRIDAIEESDKLKKQIKFKKDALPKIEAKMKEVEYNSVEHQRLKKELEDHREFIKNKGGRLKELARFFIKVKAVGKIHL